MADYDVIKEISVALTEYLRSELSELLNYSETVGLTSDPGKAEHIVNICLYDIMELDEGVPRPVPGTEEKTVLSLKYMIVTVSRNTAARQTAEEHMLVGRMIKALNGKGILFKDVPFLPDQDPPVCIRMERLGLNDKSKIINNNGMSLALYYEVYPVIISGEAGQRGVPVVEIV